MEALVKDLRFAGRALCRTPWFTAVVVLILAAGIGATTAVFTIIDATFLRPLPVEKPDRLVALFNYSTADGYYSSLPYPDYAAYREQNTVFTELAAWVSVPVNLSTGEAAAVRITADLVTGDYFSVLGIQPALGRVFQPGEVGADAAEQVVVVSGDLWQRWFGADPSLVGREIILNGRSYTVVGITPRGFKGPDLDSTTDLWTPLNRYSNLLPSYGRELFYNRETHWLMAVGRLKPAISTDRARVEMATLSGRQALAYPESNEGWVVEVVRAGRGIMWPSLRPGVALFTLMLLTVVGLVLLVACINVSNLLLARSARQRRELSVRMALGAGRGRLVRQLLAESGLLALTGGGLGMLSAWWGTRFLTAFGAFGLIPGDLVLEPSYRILCFALLVSLLSAAVCGMLPAIRASRPDLVQALKGGSELSVRRAGRAGPRNALVVAQVSIALLLLVVAGLFARSLRNQLTVDLGLDTGELMLVTIDLETAGYSEGTGGAFQREFLARAAGVPGVISASMAHIVPLGPRRMATSVYPVGREPMAGGPELVFEANVVGPAFFETVGIPLVEGRPFTSGDVEGTPRAVVVSASAAQRLWPGESPLGKQLVVRSGGELPLQVIGVVKDVRHGRIIRGRTMMRPTTATVYLPLFQHYTSGITLFVRTVGNQDAIAAALRREIQALDRYLPFEVETFHTHVAGLLAGPRAATAVLEICSLFVLVLAVSGLYGLVAYSVSRRTREFGVRIALGAQSRNVVGLVVRQGMLQVLWGVALGLIIAAVLSRILTSLLFEVTAFDTILFLALSLLLAVAGAAACYFPARRATRVDPMLALKSE